jgi:hypothetical protein
MAIYDYETLQETDPTEMERLKKKFAGNPPVNDSNYGLSRFQLTTYDGEVPVNLIGVLEELPEFTFNIDYADGPGTLWQDMLQQFTTNDLFNTVNAIGAATGTNWINFVKAGSWTKKIYNGYNPGSIDLKFKIFTADTLGQTLPNDWINGLRKYAAISAKNQFDFAGALKNVSTGLENVEGTAQYMGNTFMEHYNKDNPKKAEEQTAHEKDLAEKERDRKNLETFLSYMISKGYIGSDISTSYGENDSYVPYKLGIDQNAKTVTITASKTYSRNPSQSDKSYKDNESIDQFKRIVEDLIKEHLDANTPFQNEVLKKFNEHCNNAADEMKDKKSDDTVSSEIEKLTGLRPLLKAANEFLGTTVKKYGPYRVLYKFNRENSFGAKLWYLNIYGGTIFKKETPLIVYISNWSVKRSEETNDSGHYYYEFSITCNLDQTYSRAQWYRVLESSITGSNSKTNWADAATSLQKELSSGLVNLRPDQK